MSMHSRRALPRTLAALQWCVLVLTLACGLAAALAVPAVAAPAPVSTFLPEPSWTPAAGAPSSPALAQSSALTAPKPGSGNWYWPIGTEDFQGWSGWLDPRGSYVHIAQDMPAAVGHAVYAIGDGVVWKARMDAGGYGPGASLGGVMIVVHTTATGQQFRALYGHISGLRYKEGQKVKAGALIAKLNGCAHLHFSIHPGTTYRDGNMYAGHVPRSWSDHGGFVDPIKYLKTHARRIVYLAPSVPKTTVTTGSKVLAAGAAAGFAYWAEEADPSLTHRCDLKGGVHSVLAPGVRPPEFDTARYATALLDTTGFTVEDRLPLVVTSSPHQTPVWGAASLVKARLENGAAQVFNGGLLLLELRKNGIWTTVDELSTGADGKAQSPYVATATAALRVRFLPPANQPARSTYLGAVSKTISLTPHVLIRAPALPATVKRGVLFGVTGLVTPRHIAGKGSLLLEFQRLKGGVWTAVETVEPKLSDAAGGSAYMKKVRLNTAGSWRVRAVHPADAAHAQTFGPWRTFAVK